MSTTTLAPRNGSTPICSVFDITHTAEPYRALHLEMAVNPISPKEYLFEGVDLLRTLILAIVQGPAANAAA